MFKVGEEVYIKPDFDEYRLDWIGITNEMLKYAGTTDKVCYVKEYDDRKGIKHIGYTLEKSQDGADAWIWAEEWLEENKKYNVTENDVENIICGIV